jgi:hypothetical protein
LAATDVIAMTSTPSPISRWRLGEPFDRDIGDTEQRAGGRAEEQPLGARKDVRMPDPDRRGEHRAAVFEQKGEVRGHRRGEREDQSRDHDKWPNA